MKKKKISKKTLLYVTILVISSLLILICLLVGNTIDKMNNKPEEEKIKDTIKPTITGVKDIEIYWGEDVNLKENITVTDNVTSNIDLIVNGSYDIYKIGEYYLEYYAEDIAGNSTTEKFKLTVKNNIEEIDGLTYINGILIVNKTYGTPSNYEPDNLVKVEKTQMVKEAADKYFELKEAALNEGINLFAMTGYRSVGFQTSIYNGYLKEDTKENVDTYSARPGYSEHHTGLAVDLNSLEQAWGDTDEGRWLSDNCYKYGFIIRYPKGKENITGYMYEPWHIRYVGEDLAEILYNKGMWISIEELFDIMSIYGG